jgi:GDP-4-dehydro-6-deoxy-D-mannose reductase
MRILITGAAGFAGGHLARYLLEQGHTLAGLRHPKDDRPQSHVLPAEVEIQEADILDETRLSRVVSTFKAEAIFHLAAFSNPQSSWENARRTLETNIIGSHNVLQAALDTGQRPRVLLVGSCQQYGWVPEQAQPITEDRPQRPMTPYAVSKCSQEVLGLRFYLAEELPVFLTRPFNHTGPGQEASYVCSSFARQAAEIEAGRREPHLRVGNLSARRDFSDVRDVVRAYWRILEQGKPAEPYNVCRGEAFSIQEILERLLRLTATEVRVEVDPSLYHSVDAPLLLGDNSRLRKELGWEPRHSLEDTLRDLLDFWRARIS